MTGILISKAMNWRERITVDPKVLVGKPIIRGTRMAVEFIVELLAAGWTQEQILENYPHIQKEDIQACLAYAAELLHTEHVVPLQPHEIHRGRKLSGIAMRLLRQSGFDILSVAEASPGLSDTEVLAIASVEDRTLRTFDKDFGISPSVRACRLPVV